MPGSDVFGRDDELAVIDEFLRADAILPATLLVRGDAGIGKTTLWLHAVERAHARSFRVLSSSPAPAESELSFGGVSDLLEQVLDETIADLPGPQAHALQVALRRAEPGERAPDQFAVRAAFLGALRRLATECPVVVAIDDVQWLDRPSELAVEFAGRRLRDAPVAFVFARREDAASAPPLGLDRIGPQRRVVELRVPPLSLGAIHRLLRSRLGMSIPRPVLRKIFETSGANPFFALELGRELLRQGRLDLAPDDPLPLPSSLDVVLRARLGGLSPDTAEVLLATCSLAQPSLELLEGAYGRARVAPAIDEAVTAGLLEQDQRRLRFSHPLLASACYAQALPGQRQRVHRRLAKTAVDPEERARQLALSESGPSRDVAAALERAAADAAERGAPETAAELAELALARTPADCSDALFRTLLAAGSYALSSGDTRRARRHVRVALRRAGPGALRAEILLRLAVVEDDPATAIDVCEQALAEPNTTQDLACRIRQRLARSCHSAGLGKRALHHARGALDAAEAIGDDELLVSVLTECAECELFYGDVDVARALLRRAVRLEPRGYAPLRESPRLSLARVLAYWDFRYDEALTLFSDLLSEIDERGDEWARHRVLWNIAGLHHAAADFPEAQRCATEGLELAETDASDVLPFLVWLAKSAAHLGRVSEVRQAVERGLPLAESTTPIYALYLHHAVGLLDFARGATEEADAHLRAAAPIWEAAGFPADGVAIGMCADWIEILLARGEHENARGLLAQFEEMGGVRFPSHQALVERCRALVLTAEGETAGALQAFETALADPAHSRRPFDRARTLVCYGATLRRAKRRADARKALQEALAEFERLSTPLWAEKARAELARIGGRVASGELTETERRLADLVAAGRSNKEAAAALYVTPKTVSTQLSRIYAKLGLHSRAELVRHVLEQSKV